MVDCAGGASEVGDKELVSLSTDKLDFLHDAVNDVSIEETVSLAPECEALLSHYAGRQSFAEQHSRLRSLLPFVPFVTWFSYALMAAGMACSLDNAVSRHITQGATVVGFQDFSEVWPLDERRASKTWAFPELNSYNEMVRCADRACSLSDAKFAKALTEPDPGLKKSIQSACDAFFQNFQKYFGRSVQDPTGRSVYHAVTGSVLKEAVKGWLGEPMPIGDLWKGRPPDAFLYPRFPVFQAGKMRPIDDGSHIPFHMPQKVVQDGLGHIVTYVQKRLRSLVSAGHKGTLSMYKLDFASAYRQIRLQGNHYLTFALPQQEGGGVFVSKINRLAFGMAGSVPGFCIVSHALRSVLRRLGGLEIFACFDDLVGVCEAGKASTLLPQILRVARHGFDFENEKALTSEDPGAGGRLEVLGVGVGVNESIVFLSASTVKIKRVLTHIGDILASQTVVAAELQRLAGKLSWMLFAVGRAGGASTRRRGQALMHPLFRQRVSGPMGAPLRNSLVFFQTLLRSGQTSTQLHLDTVTESVVAFTDASLRAIGGVILSGDSFYWFSFPVPEWTRSTTTTGCEDRQEPLIQIFEMLAALATLRIIASAWGNKVRVTLYIDNESAQGAFVKGRSANVTCNSITFRAHLDEIVPWWRRVPSDANMSDCPSRDGFPAELLTRVRAAGWRVVDVSAQVGAVCMHAFQQFLGA